MKEQAKSPERELNEIEASKLLEFKTIVVRKLKEFRKIMDELRT